MTEHFHHLELAAASLDFTFVWVPREGAASRSVVTLMVDDGRCWRGTVLRERVSNRVIPLIGRDW